MPSRTAQAAAQAAEACPWSDRFPQWGFRQTLFPTRSARDGGHRGRSACPRSCAGGFDWQPLWGLGRARADLQGAAEVVELIGQQSAQRGGKFGVGQAVLTRPQRRGRHGVQRQPVAAQRLRIQLPAVEHRSAQPGGPELDKAGRAGLPAAEPDVGDRAISVLTPAKVTAEVKVDVVSADVDQPGAFLCLGVGQRTRGCSRYQRDWVSLAPPDPDCGSATNQHQLRIGLARYPAIILE